MRIKLIQIDGALPNIALMKLAHWHRAQGDQVTVTRNIEPDIYEPIFEMIYGSAIFKFSADRIDRFKHLYPCGILGGTGTDSNLTVESITGNYENYDYEGWDVPYSIGFTQRGCRLKCKFCVVPGKEGPNKSINTIANIWRGPQYAKKIHLLDNDFFGQHEVEWRSRVQEIIEGKFKVCLSQGINVRLITPEAAKALASIEYRDSKFNERRLYTAWDNIGDEKIFFKGVDMLEIAGIPAKHLMAYMLIGYSKGETLDRIFYRFNRMVERGILPYPMVYDRSRRDLLNFARWAIRGLYRVVPFSEYDPSKRTEKFVNETIPLFNDLVA